MALRFETTVREAPDRAWRWWWQSYGPERGAAEREAEAFRQGEEWARGAIRGDGAEFRVERVVVKMGRETERATLAAPGEPPLPPMPPRSGWPKLEAVEFTGSDMRTPAAQERIARARLGLY